MTKILLNKMHLIKNYFYKNRALGSVILLFLLSVFFNLYFLYLSYKSQTNDPFPLLSPQIELSKIENRIMNFAPLKTKVSEIAFKYENVKVSVYFEYLPTGANFVVNPDLRVPPASLVKVPIAIAITNKVQNGNLSLQDKFAISDEYKDPTWGELYKEVSGKEYSVEELLQFMLKDSDNTAKEILYNKLNAQDAQVLIDEIGVNDLFDTNGNINSKEIAKVFKSLYYSSMLTPSLSEMLLEFLESSDRDLFLGNAINEDIPVAHKFGINRPLKVYNDVGIFYHKNRPYIISILVDAKDAENFGQDEAKFIINSISKEVYKSVSEI